MLFAINSSVTVYALFTSSKAGKSGIAVKVAVNNPSGNIISVASATAATEVDSVNQPGLYAYTLTGGNTNVEGAFTFHFYTSDSTVDQQHLESLVYIFSWISYLPGINAKTGIIGALNTTFLSPTPVTSSVLQIVIGNDYLTVDGRQFDFTFTGWPSFTSGTAVFTAKSASGITTLNAISATIVSSTQLRVQLTRAQTLTLQPGTYNCDLKVTLSDGSIVTVWLGYIQATAAVNP